MTFNNYECDGQMDIFDFLKPNKQMEIKVGEYVENHGKRILFDEIQENQYCIADCSTCSHKWYKVVYVKWKSEDSVGYVDNEKGIKGKWSFGNSYSALTRKMYIDAEYDERKQEAATSGWWYELRK